MLIATICGWWILWTGQIIIVRDYQCFACLSGCNTGEDVIGSSVRSLLERVVHGNPGERGFSKQCPDPRFRQDGTRSFRAGHGFSLTTREYIL